MKKVLKTTIIIPAGGIGKRFGADRPKQFIEFVGVPIIVQTIRLFDSIDEVESIVIPVHNEWYTFTKELVEKYSLSKVKDIIIGGTERQHSVHNALHTKSVEAADLILVHDAVRPFCSPKLVRTIIETAEETGAAIPAINARETVKEVSKKGMVVKTLDRSKLALIQTPQGYWNDIIRNAYDNAAKAGFIGSDSAALVEFLGYKVTVVEGEDSNIKITTPFDYKVGQLIFEHNKSNNS
ncbi:MAG: 2-C-methyl-D-erythritol 4-phosphate cytidylyltransferase [Ignavibacteriae bacterium HGW-Ignavibacteriae-1]|nr:MAG: 2-C-methyl-D-erythritol 4-phosphate cytidylyltransferase [Ignavibacteriae bacterium HGW-Ignavibacteriae-1]